LNTPNYRKLALEHYPPICCFCGFGIKEVLEVAHLDGNRQNNELENLAVLCPNCHKLHDIDLISTAIVREMRDSNRSIDWKKRMKDAGSKAATTRKRKIAARKAVETRTLNLLSRKKSSRNLSDSEPQSITINHSNIHP